MPEDSKFDYAVIVALEEEANYFIDVVECGEPQDFQGYAVRPILAANWSARGRGVLICSGEMGKDAAFASSKAAIEVGGASTIFNLGIAGRVDADLSIGDVVVPPTIYDLTIGGKIEAERGGPSKWSHSPKVRAVPGSLASLARIHLATRSASLGAVNERLRARFPDLSLLGKRGVQVLSRPHACVPTVIASDDYRESVLRVERKMASMDMETAGVVAAASGTATEVLCIRAISDGADANKAVLELQFKDENRRFAMEAATAVLDRVIALQTDQPIVDPDTIPDPKDGFYFVATTTDEWPEAWIEDFRRHEELFSLLIVDDKDEVLEDPLQAFIDQMTVAEAFSPALLIGEKGVGKTTFLKYLHRALVTRSTRGASLAPDAVDTAFFLRISSFEEWDDSADKGVIDEPVTRARLIEACERIVKIARSDRGMVFVLIDGLNQTGDHRVRMIADAIVHLRNAPGIRIALTAERAEDVALLDGQVNLDIRTKAELRPLPIEDPRTALLVERFAAVLSSANAAVVLTDMKGKGVSFVDIFLLAQFFGKFRNITFRKFRFLSECYSQLCISEVSEVQIQPIAEARRIVAEVAATAFDILISRKQEFSGIKRRDTAKLISNHSSVTNFLVARHIIDTIGSREVTRSRINTRLNYVFPAEINKFTKQIMLSDAHIEDQIITFIKKHFHSLGTLSRSHCAYLAGRVSDVRADEMCDFLKKISPNLVPPDRGQRDHRMLRRSVLISRAMLNDFDAEREYAEILLRDPEEADFNRGFHLEYYGDAIFDPDGKMSSRDDGSLPCDRTVARLLDRIQSRPADKPPLIELTTLLSLVQFRLLRQTLRKRHRQQVLALLNSPELMGAIGLPDRLRGYIGRMREDLAAESFDLSTVLEDWMALTTTERTGWLRRRRDAGEVHGPFWEARRVESVAEHIFSAIGLATIFLRHRDTGEETYNKYRVMEMLLVHDLAEGRLGDKLPKHADAEAEQIELWQYGAFGTYPGLEYLWQVPKLFKEFTASVSEDAKIAQDLDRLQFMLQARVYGDGMSALERAECEKTLGKLTTKTVQNISRALANFPMGKRFTSPSPQF